MRDEYDALVFQPPEYHGARDVPWTSRAPFSEVAARIQRIVLPPSRNPFPIERGQLIKC